MVVCVCVWVVVLRGGCGSGVESGFRGLGGLLLYEVRRM